MIQPTVSGSVKPASRTTLGPKKVSAELAVTMQKKIAMHCQTRMSFRDAMIRCSRGPSAAASRARSASTRARSSGVSHVAFDGRSVR